MASLFKKEGGGEKEVLIRIILPFFFEKKNGKR